MPKTLKEFLPENDYAGRLLLGIVLLIAAQAMTKFDGAVYAVLRWVFFTTAVVNYGVVLFLYQRQKQDRIAAREARDEAPVDSAGPKA
jgi:hypothetical protein